MVVHGVGRAEITRASVTHYIQSYMTKNVFSPTFAEIADALEISKGTVFNHLRALREAGVIDYVDGEPRTITLA